MSKKDKHQIRKEQPVYTGVLKYFPRAIRYISKVSLQGNKQHHPDKPLHWDKNKSTDHLDSCVRHIIDHSVNPLDDDNLLHLGKAAWRSMGALENLLEKLEKENE